MSIVVVGAGGFAREVKWLIEEANAAGGHYDFRGYVVSDRSAVGDHDDVASIIGEVGDLQSGDLVVDAVAMGIGNPQVRATIGNDIARDAPAVEWPSLIHPSVLGDLGSWVMGRGVLLCAGVVGTVNVKLADFSLVNLSCTLGHEAEIGVASVLYPLASISGGVTIGDHVMIGTGANLLQYVSIGDNAVVGAGAVVARDVPPGVTVVGVPARPVASQ
jgi:sugar O-acyltransferase (sialic acid O-acetyltransferase NeuD family)